MISGLILVVYRICPLKLQEFSIKIYCASGNKTISVGIPTGRHDCMAVVPKVRRTVAKVRQKLSWTDKIILIVGPIDRLTGSILFLASFQTIVKSKYLIIALIASSA